MLGWFYLSKKKALELGEKEQSASNKLSTQKIRVEFQRADETATEATNTEWANGISHGS